MVIINLIISILFLFLLIKGAESSVRYSSKLAKILHISEFIVSFFIVGIISILPEATIAIISAIKGNPQLGFGTLVGANIADLTLTLGIVALFSSKGIKIESKILKNNLFYLGLLIIPLILSLDGNLNRFDGGMLITVGLLFYIKIYQDNNKFKRKPTNKIKGPPIKYIFLLVASISVILISAFFIVKHSTNLAYELKIPSVLIGITIIALGTCLPELIFSIKAIRKNKDNLAIGDILGTVIIDATIILGIVSLISPFSYESINFISTNSARFLAGIFVVIFMRTNHVINKKEGIILILSYIFYLFTEFFLNGIKV